MARAPMQPTMMHVWSWGDDVVTYYVKRYGHTRLGIISEEAVARLLGMSFASFRRRQANFEYHDTDGRRGLQHASTQTVAVWRKYVRAEMPDHLRDAMDYIERARNGTNG